MERPPPQKPVRREHTDKDWDHGENAFTETHPAYGCLQVNRIDGLFGPMFGSVLPSHAAEGEKYKGWKRTRGAILLDSSILR